MNKVLKTSVKVLVIAIIFTMANFKSNAQGNPGGPGAAGSGVTYFGSGASGSPVVPFDGGMSLILAASGIGYASKRLKKKN
jgi:hypothetical protein